MRSVFIADRLMTGLEVDDAEASHPKGGVAVVVVALVVRTSMDHDVAHRLNVFDRRGQPVPVERCRQCHTW